MSTEQQVSKEDIEDFARQLFHAYQAWPHHTKYGLPTTFVIWGEYSDVTAYWTAYAKKILEDTDTPIEEIEE